MPNSLIYTISERLLVLEIDDYTEHFTFKLESTVPVGITISFHFEIRFRIEFFESNLKS